MSDENWLLDGESAKNTGQAVNFQLPTDGRLALRAAVEPAVLFVGPANCGKTAMLASLIGESVSKRKFSWCTIADPIEFDSPVNRAAYQQKADQFIFRTTNEDKYVGSTGDFYALSMSQNGRRYCTVIEAPGEHYFHKENRTLFTDAIYLQALVRSQEKKIYIFVISYNLYNDDRTLRAEYDQRIAAFIREIRSNDRFAIVLSKIDTGLVPGHGRQPEDLLKEVFSAGGSFPNIGEAFSQSPITDKAMFTMQAGWFIKLPDGGERVNWNLNDAEKLRKQIEIMIEGRGFWASMKGLFGIKK